jgi:hypothetical protein
MHPLPRDACGTERMWQRYACNERPSDRTEHSGKQRRASAGNHTCGENFGAVSECQRKCDERCSFNECAHTRAASSGSRDAAVR